MLTNQNTLFSVEILDNKDDVVEIKFVQFIPLLDVTKTLLAM